MPEILMTDKWLEQVPRFTLPKEFSNEAPVEQPKEPASPAAPPAAEAETAGQAPATEPPELEAEIEAESPAEKATTEKDPAKASQRRFERRIDRATRRAAEAQARTELLERENAELKARFAPSTPTNAPKLEDFSDIEEYAKAYAAHETKNALNGLQQKQAQEAGKVLQARLMQDWETKVGRGNSKYDDFEEVVGDLKPVTAWAIAIMEAENGEDIAHFLGSHSKEAQRIMGLSPLGQVREIGKLEMRLSMKTQPPKNPSKAPAPIEPVTGGAAPSGNEIKPQMPFEEYLRVRKKALGTA